MSRPPRLVATDLDGTLLGADGRVGDRTRLVLDALERRGVPVVFVTGRPIRWTGEVFEHVGTHGLAVVSNGALVWDVAADRARWERPMSVADTRRTVRVLRQAMPGLRFSVETVEGWACEPGYAEHAADDAHGFRPRRVQPVERLTDRPVLKLLARLEGGDPDVMVAEATRALGEGVVVTHSAFPLLEMSAPGVTKASTLEQLCAGLGVDRQDVVAFGDMPNDIAMLQWAGTSYAMAGGHRSALAAASRVAPPHEDDGVARVLAELFGL